MKYLKKFNESKDKNLYRRVRYNDGKIEFGESFTGKKGNTLDKLLIQMDSRVLTEIEKYKTDYTISSKTSAWMSEDESEFAKYIQIYNKIDSKIQNIYEIYEVFDNYYFIIEQTKERRYFNRYKNAYWICDQLDGLIAFLKDKKVII